MEKDVRYSGLSHASSDEQTLKNETNVREGGAVSSVMTKSASRIQEIEKVICEKVVRLRVQAPASSDKHTLRKEKIVGRGRGNDAASSVMTKSTRVVQRLCVRML